MCTLGEEQRTSAFSGMAPFVAILGLISICKRDNCSHMEAIDRRGQCNFLHQGGQGRKNPYTVISVGIGRNKNQGFGERNFFQCSESLIPLLTNKNPTPLPNPLQSFLLQLIGCGDMMVKSSCVFKLSSGVTN